MRIITLGPRGTFSYSLCKKQFPNEKIAYKETLDEVFLAFMEGEYDYALVPFCNSLSGMVLESKKNMQRYNLEISKYYSLKIRYHLVGKKEAKKLLSHFHSYKQCKKSLSEKEWDIEYTSSNGMTYLRYLEEKDACAVLPAHIVEKQGLEILKRDIQDSMENETIFLLLKK